MIKTLLTVLAVMFATPVLAQEETCYAPKQIAQMAKAAGVSDKPVYFSGDNLKQFKENNNTAGFKQMGDDITGIMIWPDNTTAWLVVVFFDGCASPPFKVPADILVSLMDGIKVNQEQ